MGYFSSNVDRHQLWALPSTSAAPVQVPDDEWNEWADRVIADDLSNPERAARARRRLLDRGRGFEVR